MITHVVLLRLRADLRAEERVAFAEALGAAVRSIPSVRRVRLGRRVRLNRAYERVVRTDFEFAALLDFEDVAGLEAYLDHPLHEALAARFFQVQDASLVYDFDLEEAVEGLLR